MSGKASENHSHHIPMQVITSHITRPSQVRVHMKAAYASGYDSVCVCVCACLHLPTLTTPFCSAAAKVPTGTAGNGNCVTFGGHTAVYAYVGSIPEDKGRSGEEKGGEEEIKREERRGREERDSVWSK